MSDLSKLRQAAADFVINLESMDASTKKEELTQLFMLVKAKSEVSMLVSLDMTETSQYIKSVNQVNELRETLGFHNELAI